MRPARIVVDGRLALHPRDPRDAPEMFALVDEHRDELRAWLPWVDTARTLGDMRRYAQFAQAQAESRMGFDYAIRTEGRLVGAIGLHAIDYASRSTALGYWLAPDARGAGIVTRSARALARLAMTELEMHRIEIRSVIENTASRSVAERLGFAFEGTLVEAYYLHGVFRDIALYAAVATRWDDRA